MPAFDFYLETEINHFSSAVIVDEAGEFSTVLVDALLDHGCKVFYFGKEKSDIFHYLEGKTNFIYLQSFEEIKSLKTIDYLFFLPQEGKIKKEDFLSLTQKIFFKLAIIFPINLSSKEKYIAFLNDKNFNARIISYESVFGPRIKSGFWGNLFGALISKSKDRVSRLLFEEASLVKFSISSDILAREAIRLVFSPDSLGKLYFLKGSEIDWKNFILFLTNYFPEINGFLPKSDFSKEIDDGFLTVEVEQNFEEKIVETIDWFTRTREFDVKDELTEIQQAVEEADTRREKNEEKLDFIYNNSFTEKPLVFQNFNQDSGNSFSQKAKSENKRNIFKKTIYFFVLFFFFLFVFFTSPLVSAIGMGVLGLRDIKIAEKEVSRGNIKSGVLKIERASKRFNFSQRILAAIEPFYSFAGLNKQVEFLGNAFWTMDKMSEGARSSLTALEDSSLLARAFINGEQAKWDESLVKIQSELSYAYEQLSLVQSSILSSARFFKFLRQDEYYQKLDKYLPIARVALLKVQKFFSVASEIAGVKDKRTYLILFQNNMELRPTGGFIGSFGIFSLENGRLINFEVYDVYQADGQLKGHVEPPLKLKEYLGEANWFLRDSNWDPQFPVSARRAQWFLDKEMQITVDGTFAVNLEVAKKVLKAIGGVELLDYGEKVDEKNLFQKAEYYSELGTFAGSTQKKDFLGSLAKAIFEKIRNSDSGVQLKLARAFFESLQEREALFYFNNKEIQTVISNLGWDGGIRTFNYQGDDSVVADFLYINEANVGVNKANYFMKRKIDHSVVLGENGEIKGKLTLTYENQSISESWPSGNYKNYLRIYLPKDTQVTSVLNTDPENQGIWLPFDSRFFDEGEEYDKKRLGFLLNVPIKSQKKIEINYVCHKSFDMAKKTSTYLLLVQKQPGIYSSDYSLIFSYPQNTVPLRVIPSAVVGDRQLFVSRNFTEDMIFQIDVAH